MVVPSEDCRDTGACRLHEAAGGLSEEHHGRDLHYIQNLLGKLRSEARETPAVGALAFRRFVRRTAVPGARPLALVVHEALPADQFLLHVQRQLTDPAIAPMKVVEATAQVTIKAFSQLARHEETE